MKNRLLKYRNDLTYPEWILEYEEQVTELFESFKDDPEFPSETTTLQSFSIGIYLETTHARKRAELHEG